MKKRNKIILFSVIFLVIIIIISLLFVGKSKNEDNKLDLNKVSNNYSVDDKDIMFLYSRYHSEEEIKFYTIGNDSSEYYGLYYKNKSIKFEEFPNELKINILLDKMNYKNHGYDEEGKCYFYPLDTLRASYLKNFGSLDDFSLDGVSRVELRDDKVCISEIDKNIEYSDTIDTYFVNGVYDKDKVIIYERVAFVDVSGDKISFYRDYKKKDMVYSIDRDKIDDSFINDKDVVSNVLIEYQKKFDLYEYTYVKGEKTYYLESIER